jgi:hypothetical protein
VRERLTKFSEAAAWHAAAATTLFNLISGRFPITSGSISLNGTRIDGLEPFAGLGNQQICDTSACLWPPP